MTPVQEFIYLRTYARWLPEEGRRERLPETSRRYISFMQEQLGKDVVTPYYANIAEQAINSLQVMPSMRALWAAGPAALDSNITLYNCAYVTVSDVKAFSETLYILMCGTGVGFSIEDQYVRLLPEIKPYNEKLSAIGAHIEVADSKLGWVDSLDTLLRLLWDGIDPEKINIDYRKVRPRGSRLVIMGGRASGPEPLQSLFEFLKDLFREKQRKRERRMKSIECLDIMNKIAEIVVVGGVRRSSQISLSDLEDRSVAEAKMGEFWNHHPHRSMSNNSAVYTGKPSAITFLEEWTTLMKSGAGERGIFNREGAIKHLVASGRRRYYEDLGTNPCCEIILRDMQFCNLSEVVVRPEDDFETLRRKVKLATMFGCWQSTFTNFPYLRDDWKLNCEEERLLGVSLTGIMDNPVLNNVNDAAKRWLADLKGIAIREAEKWAKRLGTNISSAITCVKPSGTVSQLADCASGIHPRFAPHYIRRYRISATDPLFKMLKDQGAVCHPEVGQDPATASTMVLEFPVKAPEGAKTAHDYTALEQLRHWQMVKHFWTEHNPSITVYVGDDEWLDVAAWVYRNFDNVCGVSFLPRQGHVYQLAPYEEITAAAYKQIIEGSPEIDFSQLSEYEAADNTVGAKEYACIGDKCELS